MSVAVALVAAALVLPGAYEGSPAAKKAAKEGRRPLRELAIDLDGDGKNEIAVVEKIGSKLRVAILKPTGQVDDEHGGFTPIVATKPKPGRRVVRLEAMRLVGRAAPELVAVLEEPSPDDSALTVIVMGADGGPPRELFNQTFFIPKASRGNDKGVVAFGDASPHYVVEDLDGDEDGDKEIVWTREGQKLNLTDRDGKPVTFVIGAYRTIYRYDPAKGVYLEAATREVVDFLPPKPAYEVSATAQVKKIWGTAQPFWGTDGDLSTAWGVERDEAVGQSLTVKFERRTDVQLIRVVPGCATDEAAWENHDRIQTLKVELGSGVRFEIDRTKLGELPPSVRAAAEFPLAGGFGKQLLVFLERPQSLPWARVEVRKLDKSGAKRNAQTRVACIAELSFH